MENHEDFEFSDEMIESAVIDGTENGIEAWREAGYAVRNGRVVRNWDVLFDRLKKRGALIGTSSILLLLVGVVIFGAMGGSETAPPFTVEDTNGQELTLSDLSGKVVVLDLMSISCPNCKVVADNAITPLYEDYKDNDDIFIISVTVGPSDTREGMIDYMAERGYEWPHAINPSGDMLTDYSAQQIPVVIVIDADGDIVMRELGIISHSELEASVEAALAGTAAGVSMQSSSLFLFAIAAGMLSFFSPCSFPLLPGYMSYYISSRSEEKGGGLTEKSARKALGPGLAAAAGILLVFGLLALLVVPFSQLIAGVLPTLELIVGILVLILGIVMLAGINTDPILDPLRRGRDGLFATYHKVTGGYPTKALEWTISKARRKEFTFADSRDEGLGGMFWYGVGYGSASAGCTAPVFIALLLTSMKYSIFGAFFTFGLYAVTIATLMVAFTLLVVMFQGAIMKWLPSFMRFVKPVGGALLAIVGVWLIFYFFWTN